MYVILINFTVIRKQATELLCIKKSLQLTYRKKSIYLKKKRICLFKKAGGKYENSNCSVESFFIGKLFHVNDNSTLQSFRPIASVNESDTIRLLKDLKFGNWKNY